MKRIVILVAIVAAILGSVGGLIVGLRLSNKSTVAVHAQSYNSGRWFFMSVPDDQVVPLFTFSDESGRAFVDELCSKGLDKSTCEFLRDTASLFESWSNIGAVVALTHPDLVGRSISELQSEDGVFLIIWPKSRKVKSIKRAEIEIIQD